MKKSGRQLKVPLMIGSVGSVEKDCQSYQKNVLFSLCIPEDTDLHPKIPSNYLDRKWAQVVTLASAGVNGLSPGKHQSMVLSEVHCCVLLQK